MQHLSDRAARSLALAALSVACVVMGPTPRVIEALERVYAVAVIDDEQDRRRSRDRVRGARRPSLGPRHRHPSSVRP